MVDSNVTTPLPLWEGQGGGSLYFISLGPGAADMVTLGTLRLLTKAQKVYCFAVGESSRATEIISQLDIDQSKVITVKVPMSHNRENINYQKRL